MASGTLIVTMLVFTALLCVGIGVLIVHALRPAEETANATEVTRECCVPQKKRGSPIGGQMATKTINPYQPHATVSPTFATADPIRRQEDDRDC